MKQILIEVTPMEIRGALVDDKKPLELHVERRYEKSIVGNIYKGKVTRVVSGLKAIFVDIGLEKSGYMNFDDLKESFKNFAQVEEADDYRDQFKKYIRRKIKAGEEIVVQVTRAGVGDKGPKVTTNIAVPGKYVVLLPNIKFLGVSRKIGEVEKRKFLKENLKNFVEKYEIGFIVRTSAGKASFKRVEREAKFLSHLWKKVRERETLPAPRLLYQNISLSLRMVRDFFDDDVEKIYIDDREEYQKVKELVKNLMPDRVKDVLLWKDGPLFTAMGLRNIYDEVLKNIVWLPSGGYIVIQETEALTSIDVNSGKYSSEGDPDSAFFTINREAATEIAHQLRLRDIGGIIIVDFINMRSRKLKKQLFEFFKSLLEEDPGKPLIEKVSKLGLIEMTRRRSEKSVPSYISVKCPYCQGRGYVKSPATVTGEIYRDLVELLPTKGCYKQKLVVEANPQVVEVIEEKFMDFFKKLCKNIAFTKNDNLHLEKYTIRFS